LTVAQRYSRRAMASSRLPSVAVRGMASISGGQAIANLADQLPFMDIVRYDHKNVKWTYKHVDHFADAIATGLLEQGFQPGDVILSWLPLHFAEQHILQFAASKGGFVLYHLDPAQAITDPEGAKAALAKALEITEANVLVSQEAGDDVNYVRLCKEVIPEIRIFDFSEGSPFITPRFPHLRLPVHTGFDHEDKHGMIPYKHLVVPSGELSNLLMGVTISGSTPLMGELKIGSDGLPTKGKVLTNAQVESSGVWPVYSAILNKDYQEIEGVGVVF